MSVSPSRAAAFDILLRVEEKGAYAAELLHSTTYSKLSAADHGLATELVMGVLRWRSVLDKEIAARSSQKLARLDLEVLIALRLAAYQLLYLTRIPGHAAVHESVELVKRARKRSAVPFVNAVLRKLDSAPKRPDTAVGTTAEDLAESSAHPLWLVERWVEEFGVAAASAICAYDQQVPPISLRLHGNEVLGDLEKAEVQLSPGKILKSARQVTAGDIQRTPAFQNGLLSIQDEGSQLVALLLGHGSRFLDCCAAPGGKTRILAERNPSATVVAAELHPRRARLLRQLVPATNVQVIAADARALPLSTMFDRVLVDVPCSGTGTLARNPEIKWRLKPDDLADLQRRQIAILWAAMNHLAKGGRLVYSTCSLEREENHKVVGAVLLQDDSFRLIEARTRLEELEAESELAWNDPGSLLDGPFLRTIPGVHPCDGFFAAILEKS